MPPSKARSPRAPVGPKESPFSLRQLADYVGLAPATISLVLNRSAVADTIAPETRKMIFAAAQKFDYRPNFFARCLRTRRSLTIGVMVPEVSEGYNAMVLGGIEDQLMREGYFYFVASHRFRQDLIDEYPQLFRYRSVDGLIVVNAPWHRDLDIPVVTVSSHHRVRDVTRIVLDHQRAVEFALEHLASLGHRRLAFIKGQEFVPDSRVRWNAIVETAGRLGLPISSRRVAQIKDNSPSPEGAYRLTQNLLASGEDFTALFAFNDMFAMGAIRALREAGRRVPEDVSVVGFDDIENAAYQSPGLTTLRQPLRKMGTMAAEDVLRRIAQPGRQGGGSQLVVEPELIIRGTTARMRPQKRTRPTTLSSG